MPVETNSGSQRHAFLPIEEASSRLKAKEAVDSNQRLSMVIANSFLEKNRHVVCDIVYH
jgi:hypothetical protein